MEEKLPKIYFSQYFGIKKSQFDAYGAVNINLLNDTPLFIDPFLLFASNKTEYKKLNDRIINYLIFLKNKSQKENIDDNAIRTFYRKGEIYQNWLGYSFTGNKGKGFGPERGKLLHQSFFTFFKNIGEEIDSDCGHFEK